MRSDDFMSVELEASEQFIEYELRYLFIIVLSELCYYACVRGQGF